MHTHLFSWMLKVTVRRCQWWRLRHTGCDSVKDAHPQTHFCPKLLTFIGHLKWITRSCTGLDPVITSWADVDQSVCVWKEKCIYWGCTKQIIVVLLTLNVWKMLYCTFAKVRSDASLSSDVYCSLWYLCTGKVKYISRVEFGFYANRWCFSCN